MMPEQHFISWQTYYPGTGHNDWQVDFCNFLYYGLKLTKVKRILYGSSAQDINKTVGVSKTHVVRVLKIIVGVTKTSITVSLTLSTLWQYDYFLKAKRVLLTKKEHKNSNQQYQKKKDHNLCKALLSAVKQSEDTNNYDRAVWSLNAYAHIWISNYVKYFKTHCLLIKKFWRNKPFTPKTVIVF